MVSLSGDGLRSDKDFHRRPPVVQAVVLRPLLWRLVMNRMERLWWWSGGASRRRRKAVGDVGNKWSVSGGDGLVERVGEEQS
nr:hypothetical protein Iba_chr10aCG11530 [Ipomoea batatas]